MHGKPATAHNGSNYQGGNRVNAPEQFHLATVYFFLQVIFCVWSQPSPPDCYYPSPLTTSVNLLPPSIPLHPEQTQATKHAGRQKQQQQTGKSTRSKEDDPICQPSRVYSTKSVCSKKTWRTPRCEYVWEERKEAGKPGGDEAEVRAGEDAVIFICSSKFSLIFW